MRDHRVSVGAVLLVIVAILAQSLFVFAFPAQAQTPVSDSSFDSITTLPDGRAVVRSCGGTNTAYDSFASNGAFNGPVAVPVGYDGAGGCDKEAIAADGTVVFYSHNVTSGNYEIVAYKDDVFAWASPVVDSCDNGSSPIGNLGISADNRVYFEIQSRCDFSNSVELVTLELATGDGLSNAHLDGVVATRGHVRNFLTGYVYVTDDYAHVVYLDLDGEKDAARSFTPSYLMPDWFLWAVGVHGELAILSTESGELYCSGNTAMGYTIVVFRDVNGVETQRAVPEDPNNALCVGQSIHISPSGGAILALAGGGAAYSVAFVSPSSSVPTIRKVTTDAQSLNGMVVSVDIYGNTLYAVNYEIPDASYYSKDQVEFMLYDGSGNIISRMTTESIRTNEDAFKLLDVAYVATSDGAVHAILRRAGQYEVYRLPFAKIGIDYPRGVLLGDVSTPPQELNYVAMGDSFSSGEGSAQFLDGTDTSTDDCHRSETAYPFLLNRRPDLRLKMTAFVACSGATTNHVIYGKSSEVSQLSALTSATNVVTITIGGNDVGFSGLAAACIIDTCAIGSAAYNTVLYEVNHNLGSSLSDIYGRILTAAPNAEVYIVGYPHVAPDKLNTDLPPFPPCDYLYTVYDSTGTIMMPWADAQGAYDITARINATAEDVVNAIRQSDPRIHYLDVNPPGGQFTGRDVCSTTPAFYNVEPGNIITNQTQIFHPNDMGHEIYANIVSTVIH